MVLKLLLFIEVGEEGKKKFNWKDYWEEDPKTSWNQESTLNYCKKKIIEVKFFKIKIKFE